MNSIGNLRSKEYISFIKKCGIQLPQPANPDADIEKWDSIIKLLDSEFVTEIASDITDYDLSKCFKTLSIKIDNNSPYTVPDIIDLRIDSDIDNTSKWKEHIYGVFKNTIDILPPVTATLLGGYLCSVDVYTESNYNKKLPDPENDLQRYDDDNIPDEISYGGLYRPYRRSIEITNNCNSSSKDWSSGDRYPNPDGYVTEKCSFLHELGHIVHNLYGFYRPGDSGHIYPSPRNSLENTGCIEPISLGNIQSKFVLDMFRSYTYNQMDVYENIDSWKYGTVHPAESFACAFMVYIRDGLDKIQTEYPHFVNVLSHLH